MFGDKMPKIDFYEIPDEKQKNQEKGLFDEFGSSFKQGIKTMKNIFGDEEKKELPYLISFIWFDSKQSDENQKLFECCQQQLKPGEEGHFVKSVEEFLGILVKYMNKESNMKLIVITSGKESKSCFEIIDK